MCLVCMHINMLYIYMSVINIYITYAYTHIYTQCVYINIHYTNTHKMYENNIHYWMGEEIPSILTAVTMNA